MAQADRSIVSVVSVTTSVRDAVRSAMESAGWRSHVPPGCAVALKPNLCWDMPLPGAQTSPWFLQAVIEVLAPHVGDIVVVEAGQVTVDADRALRRAGLERVLAEWRIPFINMSRGTYQRIPVPEASVLHYVDVPEVLRDRVLITLPVLKTHSMTTMTGALKNQWGCLPEMRHNHHLVVDHAISDVNRAIRPTFAIMDGTVGLEGNGPKTGRPRVTDLVLASSDPVALDATASRIMGFRAEEIAHLRVAGESGLGMLAERDILVHGHAARAVQPPFRPARPGLVQRTERLVRTSRFRRLAFETRALDVFAFAARIYNLVWWLVVGRRERARIISGSRYGGQWTGRPEDPAVTGGE